MKVRTIKRRINRRIMALAVEWFPTYYEIWNQGSQSWSHRVHMSKYDSLTTLAGIYRAQRAAVTASRIPRKFKNWNPQ